jgi:KUP system potassium uptake protein
VHERVVIVTVVQEEVPHVARGERVSVDELGYRDDGIVHLTARFGFKDEHDIPDVLRQARALSDELDFSPAELSYFVSRIAVERGRDRCMSSWRKRLFVGLAHNAAPRATDFELPLDRTVLMGERIEL